MCLSEYRMSVCPTLWDYRHHHLLQAAVLCGGQEYQLLGPTAWVQVQTLLLASCDIWCQLVTLCLPPMVLSSQNSACLLPAKNF